MSPVAPDIRQKMLASVPALRAFATALTGKLDRADDLVQESLLRAMSSLDTFEPGSNMQAWLLAILRNQFYSEYRKRRREFDDSERRPGARLATQPSQPGRLAASDFRAALAKLPAEQREALALVAGSNLAYEDVAKICGCAVGTIKSRVNRARNRLSQLLTPKTQDEFGDRGVRQMMAAGGHRY